MTSLNDQPKSHASVIIVGAGPVGMLIAIRLGQAGIDTLLIESHEALLGTTRACVYMPVVLPALESLAVLDTMKQEARLSTDGISWRDIDGKLLAKLPMGSSSSSTSDFTGVLNLGQNRLAEIILKELEKYPSVTVRYGLQLASITDDPSSSTVQLTAHDSKNPDTDVTLTASYAVGTDGANSTTRKLIGLDFVGFTWPNMRMIGTDLIYDFAAHNSFTRLNFVVHPQDWAVITYTGQHEGGLSHSEAVKASVDRPQWRVAYVEDPNLPSDKDAIWSRAEQQMKKYVAPGQPFQLTRAEPYTIGQRHASAAIKGRVMLAGDALHSNNPVGGLGLTGGILDAFCYGNALVRTIRGGEEGVLQECANSRLQTWQQVTDPLTQDNIRRLFSEDREIVEKREALFAKLNESGEEGEKVAGRMRKDISDMLVKKFDDGVDALLVEVK